MSEAPAAQGEHPKIRFKYDFPKFRDRNPAKSAGPHTGHAGSLTRHMAKGTVNHAHTKRIRVFRAA
jgi:hypothetical protein